METIIFGLCFVSGIFGFIIASSVYKDDVPWYYYDSRDYGDITEIKTSLCVLKNENYRLNCILESMKKEKKDFNEMFAAHCYSCNKTFRSDKPESSVVNSIINIKKDIDNISNKLNLI